MALDSSNKSINYERFVNISLTEFYRFVTDVMADFNYSLYRTVRETENTRRIEIWIQGGADDQKAMVWIELVRDNDSIDPYLTTDVLRAMNDENVTRLFFFTNTALTDDDRDILEGNNHFIFTTEEIIETLLAIDSKKTVKVVKKRKTVKTPSGMVVVKNFFKKSEIRKKEIRIKTSATPDLVSQYTRLIRRILQDVDRVLDINEIPAHVREKLKKIQYDLLPEMAKVPNYIFPKQYSYLRNTLFSLIQFTVIYIGNFIEYESEDDLKQNREIIEELLAKLEAVDDEIIAYKSDLMFQAERNAVKVILTSGIVAFISIMLLIVVKFGKG